MQLNTCSCVSLLSVCITLCCSPFVASAAIEGPYTYAFKNNEVTITGFDKSYSGALSITNQLGGCPVTTIKWDAFADCTGLTSVTIPDGVTQVGANAFKGCRALTSVAIPNGISIIDNAVFQDCSRLISVTIPDGVTEIDFNAFSGCSSLTSVTIPDSVTNINRSAFTDCSSLTDVTIPANVASIEWYTFEGCTSLTNVTILNGVTEIGFSAFGGCESLTHIIIPASVTNLDPRAFNGCSSLTAIHVDSANTAYASVNGILFDKIMETLVLCPIRKTGSFTILASVTTIADHAFTGCSGLTAIELPDGLIIIGDSAFAGCAGLTEITIPASVTDIGGEAFSGCTSLTAITIPAGITDIWYGTFQGCSGLTEITLPESLISIEHYAFSGCSSLTAITLPENLANIETDAFSGCSGLTGITLPEGLTGIKMRTFQGCSGLTSIIIPAGVEYIEDSAFAGCSSLASITIPNSVTHFGASVFADCSSLATATLSTNIDCINSGMFSGCSSLIEITIPASVDSIWGGAFDGCTALTAFNVDPGNGSFASVNGILYDKNQTSLIQCPLGKTGAVTIPDGVTDIPWHAFDGCSGLTAITLPASVTYVGEEAFAGCTGLTEIVIPAAVTEIWNNAFGGCTSLTAINVDVGNATFSSIDGVLYNKDQTTLIQCPGGLTSITIPANVSDITWYAFDGCTGLTAINVDPSNPVFASVNGILYNKDQTTLIQCPGGLTGSITIPASVTDVEYGAFDSCTELTAIYVDPNNGNFASEDGALYDKSKTVLIRCPRGKTSITFPASFDYPDYGAFDGCTQLAAFIVDPNNAYYASEDGILYDKTKAALLLCPSGKSGSAIIPASVVHIEERAFEGCTGLTSVTFTGNAPPQPPQLEGYVFTLGLSAHTILYYLPGTTGWGATFGGHPTHLFESPTVTIEQDAVFGFSATGFGFNIAGSADLTVVVEACTNLAGDLWEPVITNTFDSTGLFYFNDPLSVDYSDRFYRVVLP